MQKNSEKLSFSHLPVGCIIEDKLQPNLFSNAVSTEESRLSTQKRKARGKKHTKPVLNEPIVLWLSNVQAFSESARLREGGGTKAFCLPGRVRLPAHALISQHSSLPLLQLDCRVTLWR